MLDSPKLTSVSQALNAAVDQLRGGSEGKEQPLVLVLDQPDVLLATAGPNDGVTSASLRELVLDLREVSGTQVSACATSCAMATTGGDLPHITQRHFHYGLAYVPYAC